MRNPYILLVWMQVLFLAATFYNQNRMESAVEDAAAKGQDTFTASQCSDLFSFSSAKRSFTMVNGWKSGGNGPGCSVGVIDDASGRPFEDRIGFMIELHANPQRFPIADCSKLSPRIYRSFTP